MTNSLFRLRGLLFSIFLLVCFGASIGSAVASSGSPAPQAATAGHVRPSERGPLTSDVVIPGQLRSFLRMAGISQKIDPEQVVPLLSRNIVVEGYQQGKPTEFLNLIRDICSKRGNLRTLQVRTRLSASIAAQKLNRFSM